MKTTFISLFVLFITFSVCITAQTVTDSTDLIVNAVNLEKYVLSSSADYRLSGFSIGRKKITTDEYSVSRSYFEYSLSLIPSNATITKVRVSYSADNDPYTFKLTKVTSIVQNDQTDWTAIGMEVCWIKVLHITLQTISFLRTSKPKYKIFYPLEHLF